MSERRTGVFPSTDSGVPPDGSRFELSAQQIALLRALEQRHVALGSMYLGGLTVLKDASNPDRLALCAHALRELMEKIPEFVDLPMRAQKESLKTKINEAQSVFNSMKTRTTCSADNGEWRGDIDVHLRKFILKMSEFFEWFTRHHPRRRDEFNSLLQKLDGTGRQLPPTLADLNVDLWSSKRDFFLSVAHHRKDTEAVEFDRWLDALERFLLDRLVPRTFEDLAELDAIINDGESP